MHLSATSERIAISESGEFLFPAGLTGLSTYPWLAFNEILETGKYLARSSVRSLYNVGANPVGSYAAQRRIIEETLPKIPCIIVNDLEFFGTCEYADIVLPCTHYFEYDWIQAPSHTPSSIWRTRSSTQLARPRRIRVFLGRSQSISEIRRLKSSTR
ncbi:MAG: molybdopterin-dependent oxidoreductase [Eggerthellaceae bacterium]